MRRRFVFAFVLTGLVIGAAAPAVACGGLIGPRGAVNLTRTATLAAHLNGIEHYITAFKYAGGGGEFGSIVPLPAMPSKIEKGGKWTLQRLKREVEPVGETVALAAAGPTTGERKAKVVYKTRVDALDIIVLQGGSRSVGVWAAEHGFRLPPDAPEVLEFYARRSPYFMAAIHDADAAKEHGQKIGDGTPIHVTIPLRNPWVPLRILGLGKQSQEFVEADVFLLTDRFPNLLPTAGPLYTIRQQGAATRDLLRDLRSDRGMGWLPTDGMTLTYLRIGTAAKNVKYDLAIDVFGGVPSAVRAGFAAPAPPKPTVKPTPRPTPKPTIAPTPLETVFAAPVSEPSPLWPVLIVVVLAAVAGTAAWKLRRTP